MEVYEITGIKTGVSKSGVNYLEPSDSFQSIVNGYIYRQVLQSRLGYQQFSNRLTPDPATMVSPSRVLGIFELKNTNGTSNLYAFDSNFMYKWSAGVFSPISFDPVSMAAYAGFAVSQPEDYISVTAYPDKDNNTRIVFTGRGIALNSNNSALFYYDPNTDLIYDFTQSADYSPPPPTEGDINRASFVFWKNERLNLVAPVLNNVTYYQSVLYSGIRNRDGNGDKFDVAGSGMITADTNDIIVGSSILGQTIALNFSQSNWVIEITSDPFNPWFIRKIPSVIGTDAPFSSVEWFDSVYSMGKTGAIRMDNRQSLRFDNKIPYFTSSDIDQGNFPTVYGGFDRITNQFLWSYQSNEAISVTQDNILAYNYEETSWSTYDISATVFGSTFIGEDLVWNQIFEDNNPSWAQWDTTEEIWNKIGLGDKTNKTLFGDNYGYIYELNRDFDDNFSNITNVTAGASTIIETDSGKFYVGDEVVIQNIGGMVELENFDPEEFYQVFTPWTVTSVTDNLVTINANSTNFTAWTTGGTISKIIKFSATTNPFNPWRDKGLKCYVGYIETLFNTNGGYLLVDLFSNQSQSPYRSNIPCVPNVSLPQKTQWISLSVNQEADFHVFRFRQFTPGAQVQITSIRIHCMPGGPTSG